MENIDFVKIQIAKRLFQNGFTKQAAIWTAEKYVNHKVQESQTALVKSAAVKHLLSKGIPANQVAERVAPFLIILKQREGLTKKAEAPAKTNWWDNIKNWWEKDLSADTKSAIKNMGYYGAAGFIPGAAYSLISGKGNPFGYGLATGALGAGYGGVFGNKTNPWLKDTFMPWVDRQFGKKQ